MSLKTRILDQWGKPFDSRDQALLTHVVPYPPDLEQKDEIWVQYLTDDGTSTGSEDMQIAAVDAPKEFWVQADSDDDIYITTVSFVIADDGADLSLFGAIAALTNGCQFYYQKVNGETIYIATALKTNWDFVKVCKGIPAFGTGVDAFRAKNVEGKVDAYIPVYDFTVHFRDGLRLPSGSGTKLAINVRDQTDEVDSFNAIAYGKLVER